MERKSKVHHTTYLHVLLDSRSAVGCSYSSSRKVKSGREKLSLPVTFQLEWQGQGMRRNRTLGTSL